MASLNIVFKSEGYDAVHKQIDNLGKSAKETAKELSKFEDINLNIKAMVSKGTLNEDLKNLKRELDAFKAKAKVKVGIAPPTKTMFNEFVSQFKQFGPVGIKVFPELDRRFKKIQGLDKSINIKVKPIIDVNKYKDYGVSAGGPSSEDFSRTGKEIDKILKNVKKMNDESIEQQNIAKKATEELSKKNKLLEKEVQLKKQSSKLTLEQFEKSRSSGDMIDRAKEEREYNQKYGFALEQEKLLRQEKKRTAELLRKENQKEAQSIRNALNAAKEYNKQRNVQTTNAFKDFEMTSGIEESIFKIKKLEDAIESAKSKLLRLDTEADKQKFREGRISELESKKTLTSKEKQELQKLSKEWDKINDLISKNESLQKSSEDQLKKEKTLLDNIVAKYGQQGEVLKKIINDKVDIANSIENEIARQNLLNNKVNEYSKKIGEQTLLKESGSSDFDSDKLQKYRKHLQGAKEDIVHSQLAVLRYQKQIESKNNKIEQAIKSDKKEIQEIQKKEKLYDKLRKSLKQVATEYKSTSFHKEFVKNMEPPSISTNQLKAAKKIMEETGVSASQMSKMMRKAFGYSIRDVSDLTRELKNNENTISNSENAYSRLRNELEKTSKAKQFFNKGFAKFSIIMSGIAATIFVFQNIMQAIRAFTKEGLEAEKAMAKFRSEINLSAKGYKTIEKAAASMSKNSVHSFADTTEALSLLMQRGNSLNEAMKLLPDTMAMARNETIDLATAADIATYDIFGLKEELLDLNNQMGETSGDELEKTFSKLKDTTRIIFDRAKPFLIESLDKLSEWVNKNQKTIVTFFYSLSYIISQAAQAAITLTNELGKIFKDFSRTNKLQGMLEGGAISKEAYNKYKNKRNYLGDGTGEIDAAIKEFEEKGTTRLFNAIEQYDKILIYKDKLKEELKKIQETKRYIKNQIDQNNPTEKIFAESYEKVSKKEEKLIKDVENYNKDLQKLAKERESLGEDFSIKPKIDTSYIEDIKKGVSELFSNANENTKGFTGSIDFGRASEIQKEIFDITKKQTGALVKLRKKQYDDSITEYKNYLNLDKNLSDQERKEILGKISRHKKFIAYQESIKDKMDRIKKSISEGLYVSEGNKAEYYANELRKKQHEITMNMATETNEKQQMLREADLQNEQQRLQDQLKIHEKFYRQTNFMTDEHYKIRKALIENHQKQMVEAQIDPNQIKKVILAEEIDLYEDSIKRKLQIFKDYNEITGVMSQEYYEIQSNMIDNNVKKLEMAGEKIKEIEKYKSKAFDQLFKIGDFGKTISVSDSFFGKDFTSGIQKVRPQMREINRLFQDHAEALKAINAEIKKKKELEKTLSNSNRYEDIEVRGKLTKEIGELEEKQSQAKIEYIGNELGAYANFYSTLGSMLKENSKEQEIANTASKAFATAQIAIQTGLAIVEGVKAILTQGSGDPYTAFGRMAAMAAMVGGLLATIGASIGGVIGGGGGSSVPTMETAGKDKITSTTGTVLGDSEIGSNSASNILELLNDIHAEEYKELKNIYNEIKSLNKNISYFVSSILISQFTGEFQSQFSLNSKINDTVSYGPLLGAVLGSAIPAGFLFQDQFPSLDMDKNTYDKLQAVNYGGALMGDPTASTIGFISDLSNWMSSSSVYRVGEGIGIDDVKIGDVTDGEKQVGGYQWVQHKYSKRNPISGQKEWYEKQTANLSKKQSDQLTEIYSNMGQYLVDIGELLSVSDNQMKTIKNYKFKGDEINTINLDGEEMEKKFNEFFSTQLDVATEKLFRNLKITDELTLGDFQLAGEGLAQTAARLVSYSEVINDALIKTNQNFDKTRGSLIEFSLSLVDIAGDFDTFMEATDNYYDAFFSEEEKFNRTGSQLSDTLNDIGFSLPRTREGFRNLVESLDLNTEAGKNAYWSMIKSAEKADEYFAFLEGKAEDLQDIVNSFVDLGAMIKQKIEDKLREDWTIGDWQNEFSSLWTNFNALDPESKTYYEDQIRILNDLYDTTLSIESLTEEQLSAARTLDESLQDTMDRIAGGDLAPSQSLEWFNNEWDSLKSSIVPDEKGLYDLSAIEKLNEFAPTYLDMIKNYSGSESTDYKSISDQVYGTLQEAQGHVKDQIYYLEGIMSNTAALIGLGGMEDQYEKLGGILTALLGKAEQAAMIATGRIDLGNIFDSSTGTIDPSEIYNTQLFKSASSVAGFDNPMDYYNELNNSGSLFDKPINIGDSGGTLYINTTDMPQNISMQYSEDTVNPLQMEPFKLSAYGIEMESLLNRDNVESYMNAFERYGGLSLNELKGKMALGMTFAEMVDTPLGQKGVIAEWDIIPQNLQSMGGHFNLEFFKTGGLTDRPAIFGEDGPEWAVPSYTSSYHENFIRSVGIDRINVGLTAEDAQQIIALLQEIKNRPVYVESHTSVNMDGREVATVVNNNVAKDKTGYPAIAN